MDIGVLGAFLGGALALLSPCGALLLPAFFASTVGSGPRLALHGAVFSSGCWSSWPPSASGPVHSEASSSPTARRSSWRPRSS